MTAFNLPDENELKIRMQKRITELEIENRDLQTKNKTLNKEITRLERTKRPSLEIYTE